MTQKKKPKGRKGKPPPEEEPDDEKRDKRSSLERLADFTRRIVAVPKDEAKPKNKH